MSDSPFIVGIDLGTTHCVVAYTDANPEPDKEASIHLFSIIQIVAPGEVAERSLLPAFLLMPGEHDVPAGSLNLPWAHDRDFVVGEYARERGSELPSRSIASAKSWLSHNGVDRNGPILPWGAGQDEKRLSPVDVVARYLDHVRGSWNHQMASENGSHRLEEQEIYLTVPASFDAVARELTVQAAQQAGLHNLTLLEEPMAAFYAWIEAQGEGWRQSVDVGDTILVCDVGGGTTDFSLIEVTEEEGNLDLRRIAVGDHILLGGDNMDLTLAYALRGKLAQEGTQLDDWQFRGLVHSCRKAKERLLANPDLESEPIVILGRGSSLIGGTIRSELHRSQIETILLEGFFPAGSFDDLPQRRPQVGVREMGLPYESDPAITRHLAAFLRRQPGESFPTAILFNGGVMKAEPLRRRVFEALDRWSESELRILESVDLDLAVALGGAYYGLARQGRGIRIRAGASRAYYIGIESSMPAVPGVPTPIKALCVVPFGMEEGSSGAVRDREFGLIVGETAVFPFLASTTRTSDQLGDEVEDWSGEIQEVANLEALLPASADQEGGTLVPIWLESRITEIGTLELWCMERGGDGKSWKLEFNIREGDDGDSSHDLPSEREEGYSYSPGPGSDSQ